MANSFKDQINVNSSNNTELPKSTFKHLIKSFSRNWAKMNNEDHIWLPRVVIQQEMARLLYIGSTHRAHFCSLFLMTEKGDNTFKTLQFFESVHSDNIFTTDLSDFRLCSEKY